MPCPCLIISDGFFFLILSFKLLQNAVLHSSLPSLQVHQELNLVSYAKGFPPPPPLAERDLVSILKGKSP